MFPSYRSVRKMIRSWFRPHTNRTVRRKPARPHLLFEALEDRITPSHFRSATDSWQSLGGNTVQFTLQQSWRRDFGYPDPPGGPTNTAPNVGDTIELITGGHDVLWNFGDGTSIPIHLLVTSVNTTQDWLLGTETFTHTYATPGNYTAFMDDTARLSTLVNNANGEFRTESNLTVGSSNTPPVSSLAPIVQVPQGTNYQFQIPASDPDHDSLTYRLSTSAEAGGAGGFVQPSEVSVSSSGLVTWNGAGTAVGQLYSVQFMVVDSAGHKTPVDLILQVASASHLQPTISASPSGPFTDPAGTSLNFSVTASDPNAGSQIVGLQPLNAPAGMTFSGFTPGTTSSINVSFTPTAAQVGHTFVVTFQATDDQGATNETSVTITVPTPPTLTQPSTQSVPENTSQSISLGSFSDSDGGPWTVSVDWGDSNSDSFNATPNTALSFSHGYADEGSRTVTVTVTDNADGQFDTKTFQVNVTGVAPVQTVAPAPSVSVPEQTPASNSGAFSADADDTISFTASQGSVTPTGNGGWSWTQTGDETNSGLVTITATADGLSTTTSFTVTFTGVAPVQTGAPAPSVSVPEQTPASNSGAFSADADDAISFSASQGTVTPTGNGGWSWTQTGDENNSGLVRITATADGLSTTTSFTVTFAGVAPVQTGAPAPSVSVPEQTPASNSGAFSADADDAISFSASQGTVTPTGNGGWSWMQTGDESDSHTVTITATTDGMSTTTSFGVTFTGVAPVQTAAPAPSVSVPEQTPASNSGAFSADADDAISFSASQGTVTPTGNGGWSWTQTGDEANSGLVTITATADGLPTTTSFTVSFTGVAPAQTTAPAPSVSVPEQTPASNGGAFSADTDDAITFSASQGTVTPTGNGGWSWTQTGDESASGPVTITAMADGLSTTTTFTVTFNELALAASATPQGPINEGTGLGTVTVATFGHGSVPESGFTATINWGIAGHTADPGTVFSDGGGNYHVTGTGPVYPEEGNYPITVTISEDNASTSTGTTLVVRDAALIGSGGATATGGVEGITPATLANATFTDGNPAEPAGDFTVTAVNWGDGNTDPSGLTVSGGGGTYSVGGSHLYAEEGPHNFSIIVTDDGGSTATITGTAGVADAPLTAGALTPPAAIEGTSFSNVTIFHFTDDNPNPTLSDFTARVTVGFGSSIILTSTPSANGQIVAGGDGFDVQFSGVYAEEMAGQTFTVQVTDAGTTLFSDGFENGFTQWPTHGSGSITTAQASTGTHSLTFAGLGAGGNAFTNYFAVTPGQTYQLSVDYMTFGDGGFIGIDQPAEQWLIGDGTFPTPTHWDYTAGHQNAADLGVWKTYTVNYTIPAGVTQIRIKTEDFVGGLNHNPALDPVYFDNITWSQVNGILASGTLTVADAGLTPGTDTVNGGTEGVTPASLSATFTDANAGAPTSDFSGTINWGDGTVTPFTSAAVSGTGGHFTVSGAHQYGEEGPHPVSVTVNDVGGKTTAITGTAIVADPAVVAGGGRTITAMEAADSGSQVVATFTDPGGAETTADYAATIAWGDGTSSAGTINGPDGHGVFTVTGSHTYFGDTIANAGNQSEGAAAVRVTITHEGTTPQTVTDTATVTDPNVVAQGGFSYSALEGSAVFSNATVALFTDPGGAEDPSDYSAVINWGDGTSSAGTITVVTPGTISADYAQASTDNTTLHFHNTSTLAMTGVILTGVGISGGISGQMGTLTLPDIAAGSTLDVAFSDPGGVFARSLDDVASGEVRYTFSAIWNGSTVTSIFSPSANASGGFVGFLGNDAAGSESDALVPDTAVGNIVLNSFTVLGSHTYKGDTINGESEGTATITVTISHDQTTPQQVSDTTTIMDPNVVASAGFSFTAQEGSATLSNVTVATFTDQGNPTGTAEDGSDYAATISWGDGFTTPGTITQSGGVFSVSGSHTYAGDTVNGASEGTATITVQIQHESRPPRTVTDSVTITDPEVQASGSRTFTVQEGSATLSNVVVATFTDPGDPSGTLEDPNDYAATIAWGDGTVDSGAAVTIQNNGDGSYSVIGSHTYAGDTINGESEGSATITVTISHDATMPQQVADTATVSDPNVAAGGGNSFTVQEGSATLTNAVVATFTDPGGPEHASDYSATIDWGDGTPSAPATITTPNVVIHVYAGYVDSESGGTPGGMPYFDFRGTLTASDIQFGDTNATFGDPFGLGAPSYPGFGADLTSALNVSATGTYTFGLQSDDGSELFIDGSPVATIRTSATTATVTLSAGLHSLEIQYFEDFGPPGFLYLNLPAGVSYANDGTYAAVGSHTYSGDTVNGESEGTATITATISHDATTPQSASSTITITDPAVQAGSVPQFQLTEGSATINGIVATFTDPGDPTGTLEDPGDYSASVDWGDGTSSPATISAPVGNGVYTVTASHTYAGDTLAGRAKKGGKGPGPQSEGRALIGVTINHDGTTTGVRDLANISDPDVQATGGQMFTVQEGSATLTNVTVAKFTDPGNPTGLAEDETADASEYTAQVSWGDGQTDAATIGNGGIVNNGDGTFSVVGSHTYTGDTINGASEGPATITVTISHDQTSPQQVTDIVSITDPNVVVTPAGELAPLTEGSATVPAGTVLATFTDPGNPTGAAEDDPTTDAGEYTAMVSWGDGSAAQSATVTNNGNGTWTVTSTADHIYTGDTIGGESEGTARITVTVSHDATTPQPITDTVNINDPNVAAKGVSAFNLTEGSATLTNALVATFADPGNPAPGNHEDAGDYAASIAWGDGTSSAGTIVNNNDGTFSVYGSHTYLGDNLAGASGESEGTTSMCVTITHDATAAQTVTNTVNVSDPNVAAKGVSAFNLTEGSATLTNVLVATFADPGNPSPGNNEDPGDYSALIKWGDGASSAGAIVNNNDGTFSVYGTHTYLGDNLAGASGESEGTTSMCVTITHDATAAQTVTNTVNVSDPNVAAKGVSAFNLTEGSATLTNALVATFTDPGNPAPGNYEDAGDYSALIKWGDGTSSAGTIVNNNDGTFGVYGSHTYLGDNLAGASGESEGTTTLCVTITHDATTPQTVTDTVNVSDPNVAATGGQTFNLTEGSATLANVLVAKFTDPGNPAPGNYEDAGDYAASIAWGDGSSGPGTIVNNGNGTFSVYGSHTYAGDNIINAGGESEGTALIRVTISHDATTPQTVTSSATIADAPLTATGVNISGTEGLSTGTMTLARFTDLGGAEELGDYGATIDWGGAGTGSTAGTIVANSDGSFSVRGSFTYTEEGSYTVKVHIVHENGITADTTGTATVADAALAATAGPNFTPPEGLPFSNQLVATFTDATPAGGVGDFTATINWGDGNTSPGTVVRTSTGMPSTYQVLGGHTYAERGSYAITVTIVDVGGSTAYTNATTATVLSNIVVLNPTQSGALMVTGQARLSVTGTVQVDSSSATALQDSGQGQIVAGSINVVGGTQINGQARTSVAPVVHAPYVADPLMSLAAPDPTTYHLSPKGAYSLSGGSDLIGPGIYTSITVSGNGTVLTLKPGIYVIAGGGLTDSGSATVTGNGVMIYNAGSNFVNHGAAGGTFGAITVSGQANFNITPMTSGPYAGLAIFQSGYAGQSGVNTQTVNLSGQSVLPGGGLVYAAAAQLQITGQSVFKASVLVGTMSVTGNAGAFQLAAGASSDYAASAANHILNGVLTVAVQDDVGTGLDANALARLTDAMAYLNDALGSFGVNLSWAAPGSDADVHVYFAASTPQGGMSDGVLGFTTVDNDVYFVTGWDLYTGLDPSAIGAGQFDFLTLATHELAHTVGLGESSDPDSVMYENLTAGTVRRTFTDSNLTLINTDADRFMKVGGDGATAGTGDVGLVNGRFPDLGTGRPGGGVASWAVPSPAVGGANRLGTGVFDLAPILDNGLANRGAVIGQAFAYASILGTAGPAAGPGAFDQLLLGDNDVLTGSEGQALLSGGLGRVLLGGGADVVNEGAGGEGAAPGTGWDWVQAGGSAILLGGDGTDLVIGGAGQDCLVGGFRADTGPDAGHDLIARAFMSGAVYDEGTADVSLADVYTDAQRRGVVDAWAATHARDADLSAAAADALDGNADMAAAGTEGD